MATRVNPAELRRGAAAGDGLRADLERAGGAVDAASAAAVRATPGFRTQEALERVQWGWRDALRHHETYLRRVGDALRLSAAGYRDADVDSARSFRALDEF